MASFITSATTAPNSKFFSKLANTRVLVLGGSTGIGKTVAEGAVEHGATVVISSSSESKLAAAVDDMVKRYPDRKDYITSYVCDLSQKDQLESNIERLLKYAAKAGPDGLDNPEGIDHVVLTAGDKLESTPLSDVTIESMERVSVIRHYGAMILAKLCLKYVKTSPSSSLTFTSGALAHKPLPGFTPIASIGGALEGMVNGLTVDLKPIRVNIVILGAVPTELSLSMPGAEEIMEGFRRKTTTGRLGTPEDVAEAYLYLMKDKFVTGAKIETNGGLYYA